MTTIADVSKYKKIDQLKKFLQFTKEYGARRKSPFYTLNATRKRLNIIANFFRKAYREDTKVVFRSVIMPTEIFFAMDMVPICLESVSAMLASSALGPRALNIAEQNYYSRDICSFARCTLGAAIENYLPTPNFLACTSYYCDDATKLFYILSKMYGKDFFLLDVPYNYENGDSVEYLSKQFQEMTKVLERRLDKKLDPDRLSEAIQLANEAREYYLKVNELRTNIPAPIRGGEAMDYAVMLAFTWGSKEMVDLCKLLYEELLERVEQNKRVGPQQLNKKLRILWRHLRPYYNDELINFIENECGVEIAFEEINYIHWEKMDPSDPYRSLARKLLANPPVGRFEHWLEATHNFVKWYKIDGVISFNHWGCRQLCSGAGILKDSLEKKGIPFLEIDGDCIDSRDYSFQQLKTRVQAFIEMLGGRR